MISLHRSMHSSQMYTPGPAMSFLTCFWLLPQNEHFSRSAPSPMRATALLPLPLSPIWAIRTSYGLCSGAVSATGRKLDGTSSQAAVASFGPSFARRASRTCVLRRDYIGLALQHREYVINQPVLFRFVSRQELVALDVPADLLLVAAGVLGQDGFHGLPHPLDLPGLDLQVTGLAVAALDGRLVDQDPRVGQAIRLPLVPADSRTAAAEAA